MSFGEQIAAVTRALHNVRRTIPTYEWGTVASVSPPTVVMDSDELSTPRPVADVLVPRLKTGQRVEVRAIGSRRDIVARSAADTELYVETNVISDVWTVAGGVTTTGVNAVRVGSLVSVYLGLGNVVLPAGEQNTVIGTIKPGWRPAQAFMPWQAWMGSGGVASGLVASSSGGLSVRYSSEALSGGLLATATYPAEPWPA